MERVEEVDDGAAVGEERVEATGGWSGLDMLAVETVPLMALLAPAISVRRNGESLAHVRLLADAETDLPPIVVHRPTMRVIDGMHRLRAAALRGSTEIEVRFYEGGEMDAFVLAVQANVTRGLPLSLAERTEAAARIVVSHPNWSDRLIATATGLAPTTVAGIRQRSTESMARVDGRIGKDGRVRPTNSAEGRRRVRTVMAERPGASLREIAKARACRCRRPTTSGSGCCRVRIPFHSRRGPRRRRRPRGPVPEWIRIEPSSCGASATILHCGAPRQAGCCFAGWRRHPPGPMSGPGSSTTCRRTASMRSSNWRRTRLGPGTSWPTSCSAGIRIRTGGCTPE